METLLAKTKVAEVTDYGNDNKKARLTRTDQPSEENKSFSQYTPQISVEILVNNPERVNFFEPGQEIYVSFSHDRPVDINPFVIQDAAHIVGLLTNAYCAVHQSVRDTNTFKCIGWQLEKMGVITYEDKAGKVVTLDFLKSQLLDNELIDIHLVPIGYTRSWARTDGKEFYLKRLT